MTKKSFLISNLLPDNIIRIGSIDNIIDFSKNSTFVSAYTRTNLITPVYSFYAELFISYNDQPHGMSFEIPAISDEMVIVITSFTKYDLESVVVVVI